MTNRKTISAILAAIITISVCCSCAAQTANSSIPEASSGTSVTADTTSAPQTTLVPQTTVQTTAPETAATTVQTEAPETATAEQTTTTAPQTTIQTTAEQTEAPKPATTTTAATTKPTPEWTESKASGTKYVNTSCYSRKKAVIGAETVALYNLNDKVTVTAKTNTGYFKLSDGSFIHGDYLSDSKVVIQTTTTTVKKQETPKPAEQTKPQNTFTVYALGGTGKGYDIYTNIYDDEDCTVFAKGLLVGMKLTVVETLKDKGVYKLDDGRYVKISDTTKTDPVEKMYYYPFDLEAIKQYIIDDAVNNYGLILLDDPTWTPEGSTWNAPLVITSNSSASLVKSQVESLADADYSVAQMKKGDYFKIYIQDITEDWNDYDENGKPIKAYAIFFLQG